MNAVAFDVKGTVAHFRRPDTTSTQLTYPFITPTAAKGLVGAILGIEDFVTNDKIGLQLLSPVHAVAQQMSMLGKDGTTFNRPTTLELLINPGYRIYYAGEEQVQPLYEHLVQEQTVYPTFLGSAFALTKPVFHKFFDDVQVLDDVQGTVETKTIVPTSLVQELVFAENRHYSRAGGFMHLYKGNRTFEKSIDFIYEREGKSISFVPRMSADSDREIQLVQMGSEVICLY